MARGLLHVIESLAGSSSVSDDRSGTRINFQNGVLTDMQRQTLKILRHLKRIIIKVSGQAGAGKNLEPIEHFPTAGTPRLTRLERP